MVAGNMLVRERVLKAMSEKYENSKDELAERILKALEAGDEAGGDKRGKLSAALMVVEGEQKRLHPLVNLYVDISPDPVKQLREIFENHKKHKG